MIEEKTLLTDHFSLSNREFRKKYSEGLKTIEISDGFEKSNPIFETSNTGKYIAIKSDEDKYLVFYSKGTNIISENYSVISIFDLDQEISKDKIYENWIVEKPALFILHNDGTWSMNEKGIINLDGKKEDKIFVDSTSSKKEPKPIAKKIIPLLIKQKDKEIVKNEIIEVIEIKEDNYIKSEKNIENLVIVKKKSDENKFQDFMNKKNKLPKFSPYLLALIAPFLLVVLIFYFRDNSKVSNTNSNETIKPDPITTPIEIFTPKVTATPVEIKPTPSPSPSLVPTIRPTQSPKPKKIVKSNHVVKKSPVIVKVKPKNILKPSSTQLNTVNKEKLIRAKKLRELEKQIKIEKLKELERKIKEEKAKE